MRKNPMFTALGIVGRLIEFIKVTGNIFFVIGDWFFKDVVLTNIEKEIDRLQKRLSR
ncbi:hypothetical protein ACFL06_00980 [Patescibacteria group bacterium]